MRAVVIRVDGSVAEIESSYESIRETLGGWMEIAPTPGAPFVMLCDEEGKLRGKPFNASANALANQYRTWEDPLVGDIVLTGPVDSGGDHTEFTLADLQKAVRV
jgi:Domain of unknown function (DUF3846)